jgi:hypothetical protein
MRKLVIYLFLGLFSLYVSGQQRTHLPYSVFGIGELYPKGSGRTMAMGRTGIALSSGLHINNMNPASYHAIDSVSFFFDFGIASNFVNYSQSGYLSQSGYDINMKHIALGFRITKNWSAGIGIAPYSQVGYKINTTKYVEGTPDEFSALLTGSGGLNQLYWDNSYLLFKRLSLGVNFTYLFGSIATSEEVQYTQMSGEINYSNTSYLNKIYADFGIQYIQPVNEKWHLTIGGVFGNRHELNFRKDLYIYDNEGTVLDDETVEKDVFRFPMYIGGGITVLYNNQLTVTADYIFQDWGKTPSESKVFMYRNTNTYKAGIEYVPGHFNQLGYFGGICVRAGYYHEDSYLEVKSTSFSDDGFTFGLGFPFFQNKTNVNLTYNYGTKGTMKSGLIKEKYNFIMVSLTLHDWWFIKRKFD